MKNILLGMIGVFITIYTVLIGLNVLMIQTQKNHLEKNLSRIVKNVLEGEYEHGEELAVEQMLREEIEASVSSRNRVEVEIQALDLQKGILSVKVTETIRTLTGAKKEIAMEKTAIVERPFAFE